MLRLLFDVRINVKLIDMNNLKLSVIFTIFFFSLENGFAAPKEDAEFLMRQIEIQFKKGDYLAVTRMGWANIDRADRYTMFKIGDAHEKLKQWGEVHRIADLMIAKNENDFQAHAMKGRAFLGQKNEKSALESFKKSAESNKKYRPAYDGLVEIYRKRENHYELRILFEDMIKEFGSEAEFYTQLCEINTKDGANIQAVQICTKAIEKDPLNANNYVFKGIVFKQAGETEKAFRQIREAAQRFPKSPFAQFTYASLLEEKLDYIDSTKFYKATTEIDVGNDLAWAGLARSAAQIKNYELSYKAIEKACSLKSQHLSVLRAIVKNLERMPASNESEQIWIRKLRNLDDRYLQRPY